MLVVVLVPLTESGWAGHFTVLLEVESVVVASTAAVVERHAAVLCLTERPRRHFLGTVACVLRLLAYGCSCNPTQY